MEQSDMWTLEEVDSLMDDYREKRMIMEEEKKEEQRQALQSMKTMFYMNGTLVSFMKGMATYHPTMTFGEAWDLWVQHKASQNSKP